MRPTPADPSPPCPASPLLLVALLALLVALLLALPAPALATTIIQINTGTVVPNQTVTYFGLPVVGLAVQSYSTTGLPGVNPNVLSNYGGNFVHKYLRDIR